MISLLKRHVLPHYKIVLFHGGLALYQVNLISVSDSSLLSLVSELHTTRTVESIHRWTSKVHKLAQDGDWVMPVEQVILPS